MVEKELRFLDQAYAQDGRAGLTLQTLLVLIFLIDRTLPFSGPDFP